MPKIIVTEVTDLIVVYTGMENVVTTNGNMKREILTGTADPLVWNTSLLPKGDATVYDGSAAIHPDDFTQVGNVITFNQIPVNPWAVYPA